MKTSDCCLWSLLPTSIDLEAFTKHEKKVVKGSNVTEKEIDSLSHVVELAKPRLVKPVAVFLSEVNSHNKLTKATIINKFGDVQMKALVELETVITARCKTFSDASTATAGDATIGTSLI